MAITAEMQAERAVVTVRGGNKEFFERQLAEFKEQIRADDRKWDPDKKVWYVYNIEDYLHLPYIISAVKNRKISLECQLEDINYLLEQA